MKKQAENELEEKLLKKFDGMTPRFYAKVTKNEMTMIMMELLNKNLEEVFLTLNNRF